ncbi:hypothetical protein MAP00_003301 [Monascus purpureus]|nr:hypothetical protein MAP00_003301 [Monascus purpureus]
MDLLALLCIPGVDSTDRFIPCSEFPSGAGDNASCLDTPLSFCLEFPFLYCLRVLSMCTLMHSKMPIGDKRWVRLESVTFLSRFTSFCVFQFCGLPHFLLPLIANGHAYIGVGFLLGSYSDME